MCITPLTALPYGWLALGFDVVQDGNRKVKPVPKDEAFGSMPAPNQVRCGCRCCSVL